MDEETLEALEGLKSLEKELGRKPAKKDVDTETRKALQDKCGSWSNVLYQL